MRRGALGVSEFYRPRLESEILLHNIPEPFGRARQYRMTKRVELRLIAAISSPAAFFNPSPTTTMQYFRAATVSLTLARNLSCSKELPARG